MAFSATDPDVGAKVAAFRQRAGSAGPTAICGSTSAGPRMIDRVRADAAELISGKPDVILVAGRRAVAVLQQTRTIPVFSGFVDPVEQGIVPNLARPGGNITGFAFGELSVSGKMLEMLKQMAPNITRVAFVFNPDNASAVYISRSLAALPPRFAIEPILIPVHAPAEIERAIETFARQPNGGLLFPGDVTTTIHRQLVTAQVGTAGCRRSMPSACS